MSNSSDSIFQSDLFADVDIDRWRDEHRRLVAMRTKINQRIQALEQIIAGADLYSRATETRQTRTSEKEEPVQETEIPNDGNSPPLTMHDAILQVVKQNPKGLEPKDISSLIRGDASLSPKIKESHPNYLYTAIARLVAKNQIRKVGSLYKPV